MPKKVYIKEDILVWEVREAVVTKVKIDDLMYTLEKSDEQKPVVCTEKGGISEKKCGRCRETLPISEFNKASTRYDGLQNWCRKCQGNYLKWIRLTKQANKKTVTYQKSNKKGKGHAESQE